MTISRAVNLLRASAVAVIGITLTSCTSVAFKLVNTPSYLSNNHSVQKNIRYGVQKYQQLDLYVPDESVENNNTLIVFVYGGGWTGGAKEQYYFAAEAFTSAGYMVAIPDYIKYPAGSFPDFVEDIALAIAWLKDNAASYAEVDKFVLMGHSAGAHIGGLLITDSRYLETHNLKPQFISSFVGIAGPYGFTPRKEKYQKIFNRMENYEPMQPLQFVSGNEPNMLLLKCEDDRTVVVKNTRRFAAKVNAKGGNAIANYYEGFGHIGMVLALSSVYDFKNTVKSDILHFLSRNETAPTSAASRVTRHSHTPNPQSK